jgi:hypothetical protein
MGFGSSTLRWKELSDEEFDVLGEDELALLTRGSRGCTRTE